MPTQEFHVDAVACVETAPLHGLRQWWANSKGGPSGVVDAADVLRVSPLTECRRGESSCDIDHFLAARTAAGRPALVLVDQLTSVGSDEAFDRAIAPLERP